MSLDVYLYGKEETVECVCSDCGHIHTRQTSPLLFDYNITHNLQTMAEAAGLYEALWRPEDIGAKTAIDLVEALKIGLNNLQMNYSKLSLLNPSNRWGNIDGLVQFVMKYLDACEQNPDAIIVISR